jgi:hypothetical protein
MICAKTFIGSALGALELFEQRFLMGGGRWDRGPRLAEIEAFVDECRADPWFQSRPELVDRLERC